MKAYNTPIRKYYKYTTIPNATITGSPTINDGIVSGFSTSKYLQLPTDYLKDGNTFIVKIRIANPNTLCTFFNSNTCVTIDVSDGYLSTYNKNAGTRYQITTCAANTWYWVKIRLSNKTKYISYSTNGQTWTDAGSDTDSAITVGSPIRFGCGVDSSSNNYGTSASWIAEQVCTGEIDFTGCSILDSNNKEIWHGVTTVEGTAESYDFYKDTPVIKIPFYENIRKYYKYIYPTFTQPILTSNGTIGESNFAVAASSETQSGSNPYKAYEAFDSNTTGSYWRSGTSTGWIGFYNPNPLNVTNLNWGYFYSYPTGGNVQGSNDNSTWTTLTTWTNNTEANFNINLSTNEDYYKYYRINITGVNKDVIHCSNIIITATEKKVVKGTSSDYDFYEDINSYLAFKTYEKGQYYGN